MELVNKVFEKETIKKIVKSQKEKCLEWIQDYKLDISDYYIGQERDSVHNGIGMMTVRDESVYDEDKLEEDALEIFSTFIDNNEFVNEWLFECSEFLEDEDAMKLVEIIFGTHTEDLLSGLYTEIRVCLNSIVGV